MPDSFAQISKHVSNLTFDNTEEAGAGTRTLQSVNNSLYFQ